MKLEPEYKSIASVWNSFRSLKSWHALRTHFFAQYDWEESRRKRSSRSFGNPVPWWPYPAVEFVDQVVSTEARVLECGAGSSSVWWSERGNPVCALESDSHWAMTLRSHQSFMGDPSCEVFEGEVVALIADLAEQGRTFDFVVVDNSGPRIDALGLAATLVSAEGFLALDNSDRFDRDVLRELLGSEWTFEVRFSGLAPSNAYAHEFTLWSRAGLSTASGREAEIFRPVVY